MESYHSQGFAEAYSELVASLPSEFEAGRDVELLAELVGERLADATGPVRVLDACCGSGRVALGLLRRCGPTAAAAAARHSARPALDILGVDNSQEMLGAARRAAAAAEAEAAVGGGATNGGAPGRATWVLADVAALGEAPEVAAWRGTCDLSVVAAGSFHHMISEADQLSCLRGLAGMLRPGGLAILDLLPPSALRADVGTPVQLGAFRRTCLLEQREVQADGGVVWRQKFWLERYNGPARSTCHNEQWSLREVSPADLRRLAAAAGLSVVRQLARWADGWASDGSEAPACSDDEARVFVLGR